MAKRYWHFWISAAVGAALFAVVAGANAAVVKQSYDPEVFAGTATYEVDASCFALSNSTYSNPFGGCSVALIANQVTKPAAIDWSATFPQPATADVLSFVIFGGMLAGVDTKIIYDPTSGYSFEFVYTPIYAPSLASCDDSVGTNSFCGGILTGVMNFAYLWKGECNADHVCTPDNADAAADPGQIVFYTPEPGSALLLLGALGAGWLTRRRGVNRRASNQST